MIFLGLIIIIICILVLLLKKFNVSKNVIIIILDLLVIIGLLLFIIDKSNIINKIKTKKYNSLPTISQEEREQAIAVIEYSNIMGIDAQNYETCYIYENSNNTYNYNMTSASTTEAGPQEEKITDTGTIKNKKQLEQMVDKFEKKIKNKNSNSESVTIEYDGQEIEKQDFLNKMFN